MIFAILEIVLSIRVAYLLWKIDKVAGVWVVIMILVKNKEYLI